MTSSPRWTTSGNRARSEPTEPGRPDRIVRPEPGFEIVETGGGPRHLAQPVRAESTRPKRAITHVTMVDMARDDFTQTIKGTLARRAAYQCSKPDCKVLTIGPSLESTSDVASVGVAAHIAGAAEKGPRYDCTMSSEERSSLKNGIWLCATHATLIDRDTERFPVAVLHEWKRQHEAFVLTKLGEARSSAENIHDEEEQMLETRHLYQDALVDILLERVSREDFERMLIQVRRGHILQEVTEGTSYSAFARYALTRAIVGDWLRDLLRMAPTDVTEDPRLHAIQGAISRIPATADPRRRRIAKLLQHMSRLEGQQIQTPGYLWIAHGHEGGFNPSLRGTDLDGLFGYMAAIDLESVRDHLHDVLETTLGLIAELDSDTVIAEEVPDAYKALMSGLNARAKILRHALRHGAAERASKDYQELIEQRDAAVELLVRHLRERA